ncbi:MAG: molybdenum cofactor synthesis protein [Bacteroidetes bacterium]|nr:molybdenum cofactor synthesis protein [Bacteroidota bacterium]
MEKKTIEVLAVNISEKKGTVKHPVDEIELFENGVKGDAHLGAWHRQVSMLATESIQKFEQKANRKIKFGEFAENITTKGLELFHSKPFDRFISDQFELEVTQIGKKCHGDNCAIFREVGNCVMPKEGIFVRVKKGGVMKAGDKLEYSPKVFKARIITLSDRASSGEYEDRSGPQINQLLVEYFEKIKWRLEIENILIPDDPKQLTALLDDAKNKQFDLVFTTGGTGIGPKDFTPEVVKEFLDKEIPGVMELIRLKYGQKKPNALLSRGVCGVMGKSLVYAMPGGVKAVKEYMAEIANTLQHLIFMLHSLDVH